MINQGKTVVDGSPKHEVSQAIRDISKFVAGGAVHLGENEPSTGKFKRNFFERKVK